MRFALRIRHGRCRSLLAPSPPSLPLQCSTTTHTSLSSFGRDDCRSFLVRRSSTESTSSSSSSFSHNLRYPDPPTTEHHNLASYAAYVARTGLDTTSMTYVGTQYEYTVAAALRRLGFDLRRIGGRSDCGIDLLGTWALPSTPSSTSPSPSPSPSPQSSSSSSPLLRILLQCKASASRSTAIGPQYIRELEGAFAGAPVGWRGSSGILGLLVAQRPATKGIRDALGRSRWPMGYVACGGDGQLQQMLWNRRAEEGGLEGVGVGVRYLEKTAEGGGQPDQELILTWKGKPVVPAP